MTVTLSCAICDARAGRGDAVADASPGPRGRSRRPSGRCWSSLLHLVAHIETEHAGEGRDEAERAEAQALLTEIAACPEPSCPHHVANPSFREGGVPKFFSRASERMRHLSRCTYSRRAALQAQQQRKQVDEETRSRELRALAARVTLAVRRGLVWGVAVRLASALANPREYAGVAERERERLELLRDFQALEAAAGCPGERCVHNLRAPGFFDADGPLGLPERLLLDARAREAHERACTARRPAAEGTMCFETHAAEPHDFELDLPALPADAERAGCLDPWANPALPAPAVFQRFMRARLPADLGAYAEREGAAGLSEIALRAFEPFIRRLDCGATALPAAKVFALRCATHYFALMPRERRQDDALLQAFRAAHELYCNVKPAPDGEKQGASSDV